MPAERRFAEELAELRARQVPSLALMAEVEALLSKAQAAGPAQVWGRYPCLRYHPPTHGPWYRHADHGLLCWGDDSALGAAESPPYSM